MKTAKGTPLQIIKLKGKDYLPVQQRVLWFREEHPDWTITTEFVILTEQAAFAKATIVDEKGVTIANAHKFEDAKGFADFREKAETGATGRALALCGYGTQFALELDEEDRIIDAPVEAYNNGDNVINITDKPSDLGDYVIPIGTKYKGKKLKEMDPDVLRGFMLWLQTQADKDGKPLYGLGLSFHSTAKRYLDGL